LPVDRLHVALKIGRNYDPVGEEGTEQSPVFDVGRLLRDVVQAAAVALHRAVPGALLREGEPNGRNERTDHRGGKGREETRKSGLAEGLRLKPLPALTRAPSPSGF
jgi:hypothetical protein